MTHHLRQEKASLLEKTSEACLGILVGERREGGVSKGGKTMQKRQTDKKTKQVRIDTEIHRLLKIRAAKERISMKALLEEFLASLLNKNSGMRKV